MLQIDAEGRILSFPGAFAGRPRWCCWCVAVHFRFLASKALRCITRNISVFRLSSHGFGRKTRYHETERQPCAWVAARRNTRGIVTKKLCLALAPKRDSASDTEILWAKSVRGVWGLANVFATGNLYFARYVPEAKRLPLGLEPRAKSPARTDPCTRVAVEASQGIDLSVASPGTLPFSSDSATAIFHSLCLEPTPELNASSLEDEPGPRGSNTASTISWGASSDGFSTDVSDTRLSYSVVFSLRFVPMFFP